MIVWIFYGIARSAHGFIIRFGVGQSRFHLCAVVFVFILHCFVRAIVGFCCWCRFSCCVYFWKQHLPRLVFVIQNKNRKMSSIKINGDHIWTGLKIKMHIVFTQMGRSIQWMEWSEIGTYLNTIQNAICKWMEYFEPLPIAAQVGDEEKTSSNALSITRCDNKSD